MGKYALHPRLRDIYIARLTVELRMISGAAHERFGQEIINRLVPVPMIHRGLNLTGAPVGYTVDSASDEGLYIAEYSSDADYFRGRRKKLWCDLKHAIKSHAQARYIWLINNTEANEKTQTFLKRGVAKGLRHDYHVTVYDSRRLAEYIVDNLLLDASTSSVLAEFLPSLKIFSQEMAATHSLPDLDNAYVTREAEETQVLNAISSTKVIAVYGFSGTGKSKLCNAIAHRLQKNFHVVVWVDAEEIKTVQHLRAVDIWGSGAHISVLGLLQERNSLVVLDDLRVKLDFQLLAKHCGASSRMLITTQLQQSDSSSIALGTVNDIQARAILNQSMTDTCPEDVFQYVQRVVGGHPLSLALLNAFRRETFASWDDIRANCAAIDSFLDDWNVCLAERILGRASNSIMKELQFVRWCNSPSFNVGLARYIVGDIGIQNLRRFNFLAQTSERVLRVHEIVFSAIQRAIVPDVAYATTFTASLKSYLVDHAWQKDVELLSVIYQQYGLVTSELRRSYSGALAYGYLLATPPEKINYLMLPTEEEIYISLAGRVWDRSADVEVLALIELLERRFLFINEREGEKAAKSFLTARLHIFDDLATLPNLPHILRTFVEHHRAKALRRLDRGAEARTIFEALASSDNHSYATRLQLARIYAQEGRKEEALKLIVEILEAAKNNGPDVSPTVLLEVMSILKLHELRSDSAALMNKYSRLIADTIISLAPIGYEQALQAFAAVASEWAFRSPDLFVELLTTLPPITTDQSLTKDEQISWGQIFLGAADHSEAEERLTYARKAVRMLELSGDQRPFILQRIAKAYLLAEEYSEALKILDKVPADKRNEWFYYWRSKVLNGLHRLKEAYIDVNKAIESSVQPFASFYAQRAAMRLEMGDEASVEDLEKALQLSADNPRYKQMLEERLKAAKLKLSYKSPKPKDCLKYD